MNPLRYLFRNKTTEPNTVLFGMAKFLYTDFYYYFFFFVKATATVEFIVYASKIKSNHIFCVYSGQWFIIVIFKCCVQIHCDFIANMFHSDRVLDFFPVNFNFLFIACCSIYNYTYTSIYICDF